MSKHTQGPWAVLIGKNGKLTVDDVKGGFPNDYRSEFPIAIIQGPLDDKQANARLIAAAPELLEALELSLNALERWHNSKAASLYGNDSDKARLACINAINKAKGE